MEEFTFEQFVEKKQFWLNNLDLIWLIEGHLTKESALQMVKTAEDAIQFRRLNREAVPRQRVVKLQDRSVYTKKENNLDPNNPNAYCRILFQSHQFDKEPSMYLNILATLLKEPIFTKLRT